MDKYLNLMYLSDEVLADWLLQKGGGGIELPAAFLFILAQIIEDE